MIDLEQILYHRRPMIFIDDVVESDHDSLVAIVRIRKGIPFYAPDYGVPAWVGLEYMAQSIAALAGLRATGAGKPVPLGLIIGCRNYACETGNFAPGLELRISVRELAAEEYGLGSFDCTIADPALIAQARVSVFGGDRREAA